MFGFSSILGQNECSGSAVLWVSQAPVDTVTYSWISLDGQTNIFFPKVVTASSERERERDAPLDRT